MPLHGGALNPRNITFLDSFLAHKGSQFLDPYLLFNALRKPPYNTRLTHLKLWKIEAKKTHIMYIRTQTVSYIQITKNGPKHQFHTKQPIRRRRSRQQQKY
jgi:hypothetical protein